MLADARQGLSLAAILHGVLHHIAFFAGHRLGFVMRCVVMLRPRPSPQRSSATMAFMYEKATRLSKQAMARVSTGHITNMVSSDSERCRARCYVNNPSHGRRFVLYAPYFPFFLVAPAHAAVATALFVAARAGPG